jgi:hypothetical protein
MGGLWRQQLRRQTSRRDTSATKATAKETATANTTAKDLAQRTLRRYGGHREKQKQKQKIYGRDAEIAEKGKKNEAAKREALERCGEELGGKECWGPRQKAEKSERKMEAERN